MGKNYLVHSTRYATLSLLLGLPLTALAAGIAVANDSFDLPDAAGGFIDGIPSDWTASNEELIGYVEDLGAVGFSGGDGTQYAGLRNANGYIYQDLGVAWQPNTTYTVDLLTAHRSGYGHGSAQWGLFSSDAIGTDIGTPGFADIQGIWTGTANPDADDVFDTLRSGAALSAIGSGALGNDYVFTTGAVAPTGNVVVFIRLDQATGDRINFDKVTVDATPIPEPASIALLSLGGLLIARRRRG